MRLATRWRQFWFAPQPTTTLGIFRMSVGALVVIWTLALWPDAVGFFTTAGVGPDQDGHAGFASVLWQLDSPARVNGALCLLLVAALMLAVGLYARTTSVLVAVLMTVLQMRNPLVFNHGDELLRLVATFLVFAPSDVALSVDNARRGQSFWATPARAQWALRLVQIQLSVMYLTTVVWKLFEPRWADGTAMWFVWHLDELQRVSLLPLVEQMPALVPLVTFSTLGIELMLGLLIWVRPLRLPVLAMGVALHLAIDLTMTIGLFSLAVFAAYVAFIPPETADRLVVTVRTRLREGREAEAADSHPPAQDRSAAALQDSGATADHRE